MCDFRSPSTSNDPPLSVARPISPPAVPFTMDIATHFVPPTDLAATPSTSQATLSTSQATPSTSQTSGEGTARRVRRSVNFPYKAPSADDRVRLAALVQRLIGEDFMPRGTLNLSEWEDLTGDYLVFTL